MTSSFDAPPAKGMSKVAIALIFLGVGLVLGFFAGIGSTKAGSAFLENMISNEANADVAHPKTYSRPGYSFKYAGNWKIDTGGAENNPDNHVNVESPGSCLTMLFIFDTPLDPAENVKTQVEAMVPKLIAVPIRTPFTKWGKFTGQGVLLKGKILGINEGTLRIFSTATDKRSFIAVEQCFDEDMAQVKPGLQLVESSFNLTP